MENPDHQTRTLQNRLVTPHTNNTFSKEFSSGVLRIIPVVDVPHDDFVGKFPLMQDKKYARWSPSVPDQLTASIQSPLNRHPSDWYFGIHPTDYTGEV